MSARLPGYERWLGRGSLFSRCLELALKEGEGSRALWEAMEYTVLSGGKRFRPYLLHASVMAYGGDIELAAEPSVAVELIHTYSLIHDDLPSMDDDDFRRGMPSNHKVFGEAMAILAGDALQSRAFETILDEGYEKRAGGHLASRLALELAKASGASGMAGGQALDMTGGQQDEEALAAMHDLKTGALIGFTLRAGALIAGSSDLARADRIGILVGRAFQVRDDVLDATSTKEQLGKTPGKDAEQGKFTYVTAFGLEGAKDRLRNLLEMAEEEVKVLTGDGKALLAAIGLLRA
ncbi:MAG TPA: polyprenyl synthetase family protein [Bacillota bacterium]|nr:polyprenyl synthetase family protein [Bacillota bacterium]